MKRLVCALVCLVALKALTAPASADDAPGADCQQALSQARSAYYSLRRHGFNGFKATVEPNWEVTLGQTSTEQSLKVFRSVRFFMVAEANGSVTVTYEIAETEKARVEAYIKAIHENVQRLVGGFFGTWSRFTISSPFPENEVSLKIEDAGKECRFAFTTESADVALAIANDASITEWKLSSPRAKRTIKPLFQKTPEGLLLKGYSSLFEPVGNGIRTALDFTLEYQDVDGLKLPGKLEIRGTHGSESVAAELRFTQHVLNPGGAIQ